MGYGMIDYGSLDCDGIVLIEYHMSTHEFQFVHM